MTETTVNPGDDEQDDEQTEPAPEGYVPPGQDRDYPRSGEDDDADGEHK